MRNPSSAQQLRFKPRDADTKTFTSWKLDMIGAICADSRLTSTAKVVAIAILSHVNKDDGATFPSDQCIADETGNADWIAADLLAQAEHDTAAQSILITDSAALADEVERAVQSQLSTLPRAEIAQASWNEFGAIILYTSLGPVAR